MTCSSGTKRSPSGITTKRGSSDGTLTRAKRRSPECGSPTMTPRLSDSVEMYGKGCPGSTARGVSTGKILRWNSSVNHSRSSSSSWDQLEKRMPTSASDRHTDPRNTSSARTVSARARVRMASSCSDAVMPSTLRRVTPAATRSFRPATRTWKNSSRFWLKIARNLTRSSSGVSGSSASASTRELKSSQDSSRFR